MPFIDKSPLNYPANQYDPIRRYTDTRPPAITDFKQFKVGDEWLDQAGSLWYKMVYRDQFQGIWQVMTSVPFTTENLVGDDTLVVGPNIFGNINVVGGPGIVTSGNPGLNTLTIGLVGGGQAVDTVTPDSGGATAPDALGNINYLGDTVGYLNGIHFFGAPGANTISARDLRNITKYVVDPVALETEYQTIQAALDAANAAGGGIVYVRPGTYVEDLTLYDKTQIVGAVGFADTGDIIISGIHTPPVAGGFVFRNVTLNSATHIFNSAAAGTTHLIIGDAAINVVNGYTFNLPNWTGKLEVFDVNGRGGTNDGFANNTAGSELAFFTSAIGQGNANPMICSGNVSIFTCAVNCPIEAESQANVFLEGNVHTDTITLKDQSYLDLNYSELIATGACIVHNSTAIINVNNISIATTNVPAIDGTGTIQLGEVNFLYNANIAGAMTLLASQYTRTGPQSVMSADATDATEDAWTKYEIQGVAGYSWGVDNSDTDNMKLTDGVDPSNGTEILKFDSANAYAMTLNNAYTFPTTDGALNDVLTTDGAGTVTWQPTGVGFAVQTLTGDAGGAVGIDAFNNINLLGGNNITVTGNPITFTLSFAVTGTTDHAVQIGNATNSLTSIAVGNDGELLIGATGADPAFAALTSIDGSIIFTPGANTLDLSAVGGAVNEQQIYYVGKHGNDANSGLNIEEAFLTFGAAITAAIAMIPSAVNRYVIWCFDEGIYTENINCQQYIDIYAPNATLVGVIDCADNSDVKFHQLGVATATIGVVKTGGTSYSNIDIDIVSCAGSGIGFLTTVGVMNCRWKELYVVDGFGVGDLTSATGHMHVSGGDIYISGTGTGIARANTGSIVGHIDHILDTGAGATTAIAVFDGTIDVNVNKITCDTAYSVSGATSILRLFCNELIGTRTTALGGTAKNWVPQDQMANGTLVIGAGVGSDPVVASLTAGANVTITPGAGSITIAATGSPGGVTWQNISASQALVVNNGYNCTGGAALSLSLPATSAVGTVIEVVLDGSTSWTITQGANQQIRLGSSTTTLGAGGSLASTAQGDAIRMVCKTANLLWSCVSGVIGNITVV